MAIPTPGDNSGVTLDEVYAFFREFLGRDPDFATEAQPRVGNSRVNTYYDIRCSQEAVNYRANHGAEPDLWCSTHDRNGGTVAVPQPPPQPPAVVPPSGGGSVPQTGIPGVDGALRWLADVLGQKLADARAAADAAAKHIQEQTDLIVSNALPAIQKAANNLQTQLATTVDTLIPNTLALLSTGLGGIGNLISTFLSNAADIGDITDVAAQTIKDHAPGIEDFVHNAFSNAIASALPFGLINLLPSGDKEHPIRSGWFNMIEGFAAEMRRRVNG